MTAIPPICGYPIPDHRLHCLEYTRHGWICDIMRESDGMHFLGRSRLGPLEAWEEALSRPAAAMEGPNRLNQNCG